MIPNSTIDAKVIDSNFSGEKIGLTIDEESLQHIMSVLTDLYSDTQLAVIREYSTNARDSHIDAGTPDKPIQVTTPNVFYPFFEVRDFGIGMSLDDIRNTYSKYGSSTKRNSNAVNGMLGLGAKSALTYTSSFTVTAVKDGIKNVVSVNRTDTGGDMEIVSSEKTDEPNGVSIMVPVPRSHQASFQQKINSFFTFWEDGTVEIDGKVHVSNREGWIEVGDDGKTFLVPHGYGMSMIRESTFVMGGVTYPTPYETNFRDYRFIHFADMGELVFSPSRESLLTNSKNKAVHDRVVKKAMDSVQKSAQANVDKATSLRDAVKRAQESYQMVCSIRRAGFNTAAIDGGMAGFIYKGRKIKDYEADFIRKVEAGANYFTFRVPYHGGQFRRPAVFKSSRDFGYGGVAQHTREVTLIIEGMTLDNVSGPARSTVIRGLRELDLDTGTIIGIEKASALVPDQWLEGVKVISMDEVREANRKALRESRKSAPANPRPSKNKAEADVITNVGDEAITTAIKAIHLQGDKVVYLTRGALRVNDGVIPGSNTYHRHRHLAKYMSDNADLTFVVVPPSEQDAFAKRFPKALSLEAFRGSMSTTRFVDRFIASGKATREDLVDFILSTEEERVMDYSKQRDRDRAADILLCIEKSFDNDTIKRFKTAYDRSVVAKKEFARAAAETGTLFNERILHDYLKDSTRRESHEDIAEKFLKKYPLLSGVDGDTPAEHVAAYIEAVDDMDSN